MFATSSTEFIRSGRSDSCGGREYCRPQDKSNALVLIPARNEAATIGQVVRGCRRAGFPVIVIDDASSDATALLAAQAGAEVFSLPGPHHGKTAALHHALARLPDAGSPGAGSPESIDWLLILDGDGQ